MKNGSLRKQAAVRFDGDFSGCLASAYEKTISGQVEGRAGGGVGVFGVRVSAVGSVLEGGAQGVDAFEQGVAGDALDSGGFLGVGLVVLSVAVFGEVVLDGLDLVGADAGEIVGFSEGDEGVRVLEQGGAVGVESLAKEVGGGVEVGGGIAVGFEQFFLLFGGTLDAVELGDEEALGAFCIES